MREKNKKQPNEILVQTKHKLESKNHETKTKYRKGYSVGFEAAITSR